MALVPSGKSPAGRGAWLAGITQASYVFPRGAAPRPATWSVAVRFGPSTTAAVTIFLWLDWLRETPRPTAMQAAAAAATASPRATQRRRRSGTTFERSAAAASRIDARSRAGGAGATAPKARARRRRLVQLGELLAALLALAQVPLVGLGLFRVERVQRVGSGQVVGIHDVSVPGSPSSSRMRDRPPNIRLLMVPSGWPSLSASSDWVKPP